MSRLSSVICLLAVSLIATSEALANPLDAVRNRLENGATANRAPDDNVEGTVWEYKGKLEKGQLDGKKEAQIAGAFRLEGEGIFAIGDTIRLPGLDDIEELIAELRKGRAKLIKLPDFKPKRIGDFKISKNGRLTLSFDDESEDPNALFGQLILRPKKRQTSVFIGDFREKEDKKTIRTWQMTVRKIQD